MHEGTQWDLPRLFPKEWGQKHANVYVVKYVPVNYAFRSSGPVAALTARVDVYRAQNAVGAKLASTARFQTRHSKLLFTHHTRRHAAHMEYVQG
jgi:hypothetical protein